MNQPILLYRSGSVYANETAAWAALDAVTHKKGQPIVAFYTLSSPVSGHHGSSTIGAIFAIGIGDGVGQYKACTSHDDMLIVAQSLNAHITQFNQMFEYDANHNAIKAKLDFYTTDGKSISAGGIGSGSSASLGALYQLVDVMANSSNTGVEGAVEGSVLAYDATAGKWKAIAQSEILPDMSGYYTKDETDSAINTAKSNLQGQVDTLQALIPATATADNQLADKDFVNSSIATATAEFRGSFTSLDELKATSGNLNDYAFYLHTDSVGNSVVDRYKWTTAGWLYEYTLNNSSFTAEQWAALNSAITATLVQSYNNHLKNSTIHITSDERTKWNNKWDYNEETIKAVKVNAASSADYASSAGDADTLDGYHASSFYKHATAYPYGSVEKPWHKIATFSQSTVGLQINTSITFYVSEFFNSKSYGIFTVRARARADSASLNFLTVDFLVNAGIYKSDIVATWKNTGDGNIVINVYAYRVGWSSFSFRKIEEQAWGEPQDKWTTLNASDGNENCYASIPSDENQVVSTNIDIYNNVASATKLLDDTAYTAWGKTFFENGKPKNVSGDLIDVGNITASGKATIQGDIVCGGEVVAVAGEGTPAGVTDYSALTGKPQINGVTLVSGNNTLAALGIQAAGDYATNSGVTTLLADYATKVFVSNNYAGKSAFNAHTADSDIHITATERAAWNAKWNYNEATIKAVKVTAASSADSVAWAGISGKPTTFTPSAHTHIASDVSGLPTSLKNPYALSFGSKTYDGSAAATITASDLGALTAHQSIYALTLQVNGTSKGVYNPASAAKTINIVVPTKTSDITNDSGFITSAAIPTALKNPYAVEIKANGVSLGTYDGSAAATFNLSAANVGAANKVHSHYSIVTEGDNRWVATTPNDYVNSFVFRGIKENIAISSPSSCEYSYLIGLRGWSDSSGGDSHELAFNNSGIFRRQGSTTEWGSWYQLIDTGNFTKSLVEGVLTGNITSHTHNYLPLSGGTMTGSIKFNDNSLPSKTLSYVCGIDAFGHGGEMGWMSGSDFVAQYAPTLTGTGARGTWGIDITGNAATATNADKLDGYHSYAFRRDWGTKAGGSHIGWVRIMKWTTSKAGHFSPQPFLLSLYRAYTSPATETYTLSFTFGWNTANIVQLNGNGGNRIIEKFRISKTTDQLTYYLEYYVNPNYSIYTNACYCIISSCYDFDSVELINEVASGDTSTLHEITTKLNSIVGNIEGSATKLQTPRTIWGQSFDGTSDVNGDAHITGDLIVDGEVSALVA